MNCQESAVTEVCNNMITLRQTPVTSIAASAVSEVYSIVTKYFSGATKEDLINAIKQAVLAAAKKLLANLIKKFNAQEVRWTGSEFVCASNLQRIKSLIAPTSAPTSNPISNWNIPLPSFGFGRRLQVSSQSPMRDVQVVASFQPVTTASAPIDFANAFP